MNVDCWIVQGGGDDGKGYPRLMINGVRKRMHVWMYELLVGPTDGEVHHVCEEPRCINPWHLTVLPKSDHSRLTHSNPLCRKCGRRRTEPRSDRAGFRCGPCRKEWDREYHAAHREERVAYMRERRRST